ncbi:hypothetical protein IQ266_26165, partial [filamentous cyanobacterium LEGE 11480]
MSQKILGHAISLGAVTLLFPAAAQAQMPVDNLLEAQLDVDLTTQDVLASANSAVSEDLGVGAAAGMRLAPASAALASVSEPLFVQAFLTDRINNGTDARRLIEARQDDAAPKIAVDAPVAKPDDSEIGSLADSGAAALRRRLLIKPLALASRNRYSPGSTAGGPSAFGASFGDAFTGLSFSSGRPSKNVKQEADGAVSTGFGIGDPRRAVGLEVNVSGGSIRKFAANGDVGLKLHRSLPGNAAIAVGWDSGITWGSENRNTVSTLYGVATKAFPLKPGNKSNSMPLTVSLGIGGGRFRSFDAIAKGRGTLGVFGSVGLQVAPQASLVSTWTGRDLNMGVSFVPIKTTPLFVTAVAANVFGNNDQNRLFSLSVGYGFNYSG